MIRALRWKVVAMFMALITVVLSVVLTGVYFSSRRAGAARAVQAAGPRYLSTATWGSRSGVTVRGSVS